MQPVSSLTTSNCNVPVLMLGITANNNTPLALVPKAPAQQTEEHASGSLVPVMPASIQPA